MQTKFAISCRAIPTAYCPDKLRGDWLRLLGKNQDWVTFLAEYPLLVKSDVSLQCYAIRGRIAQGETLALKDGVALWFTGKDLPEACTPLFEQLIADKLISHERHLAALPPGASIR